MGVGVFFAIVVVFLVSLSVDRLCVCFWIFPQQASQKNKRNAQRNFSLSLLTCYKWDPISSCISANGMRESHFKQFAFLGVPWALRISSTRREEEKMAQQSGKVLVVGAGVTGAALAHLLQDARVALKHVPEVVVWEKNNIAGGRMMARCGRLVSCGWLVALH